MARGGDRLSNPGWGDRLLRLPVGGAPPGWRPHDLRRRNRLRWLRGGRRSAPLLRFALPPARAGRATNSRSMNSRMAWDRLVPPERGGDVVQREPLAVAPLRRLSVDELVIEDDDLPQADGATLFWLGRRDAGWEAWAARIEGADATPWLVSAQRLEIVRPDPALLALIGLGEGES